ncbi:MAG: folate-binding protein, partial [Alphaproteobacteria bacterium]|nr:folate-binding protein [Alphaproteobacteria bacterium]
SPEAGAIILLGDREAGEMRSAEDGQGLALIRLEALQNLQESGESALRVGDTRLTPRKPGWAGF